MIGYFYCEKEIESVSYLFAKSRDRSYSIDDRIDRIAYEHEWLPEKVVVLKNNSTDAIPIPVSIGTDTINAVKDFLSHLDTVPSEWDWKFGEL